MAVQDWRDACEAPPVHRAGAVCLGRRVRSVTALTAPGVGFDASCPFAHLVQWTPDDTAAVDEETVAAQVAACRLGAPCRLLGAMQSRGGSGCGWDAVCLVVGTREWLSALRPPLCALTREFTPRCGCACRTLLWRTA